MNKKQDSFRIDGNVIVCTSSSGKEYNITSQECSCAGFSYRRNCRHHKEAKVLGLFAKIEEKKRELGIQSFSSPHIVNERKKAIAQFLEKNGLEARPSIVSAIEPYLNKDMTPDKLLMVAKKLLTTVKK